MSNDPTLKLDPKNARVHPPRNSEGIQKSLADLGAGRSIVVDREGVVIGGNEVLKKAIELELDVEMIHTKGDKLIVVVRDDLATDDPRRKMLAIADNKLNDLSEFDYTILAEAFKELSVPSLDLSATGFETYEIEPLLLADFTPPPVGPYTPPGKTEPKLVTCPKCGNEFEIHG